MLLVGLPVLINLITFFFYSHVVLAALFEGDESYEGSRKLCLTIMNFCSLFFVVNELPVLVKDPRLDFNIEKMSGFLNSMFILWNSVN